MPPPLDGAVDPAELVPWASAKFVHSANSAEIASVLNICVTRVYMSQSTPVSFGPSISRGTKRLFAAYCDIENRKCRICGGNFMMDSISARTGAVIDEPSISGVSWGAITAGAVVSCALTFVVLAFGVGLGLTVVSPWAGSGISATTFKIGTGLYLIVIAMLSSSIGGYIAGRLRSRWIGVHSDEVYFRDTAHGFIAWALATVLGAVLLASPAGGLIGGAASGVTSGAASAAQASGHMDGYVDTLLRSDTPTAPTGSNATDPRNELMRLFTSSFRSGSNLKPADRDYVAKVVATRTGLSQADANKRVDEVVTQAKSDIDAARKATAQLAFWLTASLLLGALCASLAATEGGGLRDGTWGRKSIR